MYYFVQRYTQFLALILFLGAGLVFTATPAQAQMDIKPGVRAGVNSMSYGGDAGDNVSSSTGFLIGGFATLDFGAPVLVQPELMYIQKGAKQESSAFGATITNNETLNYIELPILAKYQIPAGGLSANVFAGPSIGFNIGGTASTECSGFPNDTARDEAGCGEEKDFGDLSKDEDGFEISSTDFGLVFGAGVDFGLSAGTVSVDVRYQFGLTNTRSYISEFPSEEQVSLPNQGFIITAGFAF